MRRPAKTLAVTVRRLREQQALTREGLAQRAGITTGTLARLELGQSDPPWSTVQAVADGLGLSLGELGAAVDAAKQPR